MKKRLYFDTSAIIKEFVIEEGSDLVDRVTTLARTGDIQIISSVWTINETIAVVDRLTRRPKNALSRTEQQEIMATFAERMRSSDEHATFRFALIDHALVTGSRLLIDSYHISADDALHIYTAFIYDCNYLLIHDNKIVSRLKTDPIQGMEIIDLGSEADCQHLLNQLRK